MTNWEEQLRKNLDIKYEILEVSKQPKGNREQWIESDVAFIRNLLKEEQEKTLQLIVKEINIARSEGTPTARLTSLYNKIDKS